MIGKMFSAIRVQTASSPAIGAAAPHAAAVSVALLLWASGLPLIDMRAVGDLGLVAAMPPQLFLALLVLNCSFAVALARPAGALMAAHLGALALILYGTPALVQEHPRFMVTWLHAGFSESIGRTGELATLRDARFSWPGFFILGAVLTDGAGAESALAYAAWAPLALNLLYLGPIVLIARSATSDERHVWLTAWVFCAANWVGQDYFSPQGLSVLLYLTICAVLLTWFRRRPTELAAALAWLAASPAASRLRSAAGRRPALARLGAVLMPAAGSTSPLAVRAGRAATPAQRAGLLLAVVALFLPVAMSHQLTPFIVVAAVAALAVSGCITPRWLPALLLLIALTWISYMTTDFLRGHLGSILEDFGRVGDTVRANVAERLTGSAERAFVVRLRVALTLAIWVLAALGVLKAIRRGAFDLPLALVAAAPFVAPLLQSYGGEVLMRVYFFALPFMSFYVAALLLPARHTPRAAAVLALAAMALCAALLVARYGNERMDWMSPEEVAAAEELYRIAEPGAMLIGPSWNAPWQWRDYERYRPEPVGADPPFGDVAALVALMRAEGPAYYVMTRSQRAHLELLEGLAPGEWERFDAALRASPDLELRYANRDAKIFGLRAQPAQVEVQP